MSDFTHRALDTKLQLSDSQMFQSNLYHFKTHAPRASYEHPTNGERMMSPFMTTMEVTLLCIYAIWTTISAEASGCVEPATYKHLHSTSFTAVLVPLLDVRGTAPFGHICTVQPIFTRIELDRYTTYGQPWLMRRYS